ncbi:hypothetical protein DEI92_01350 [Curtobacterium sp. MCBD17_034]|uniref:hypothetical protein n=1 Tax=unclassified Curtobacterium TaxID=257496 RepID=UPI000DA7EFA8|nr:MULTISPECIES: hypothetical protein [unclassified Curtobacterium]PZF62182.1 hypothetical protein DEI92_01350 [Curtobacterium sp. MCBD17_034]PZM32995.1 hypothetical protein DEI90_14875 [Curtobacterium sp. MCBD17_031]
MTITDWLIDGTLLGLVVLQLRGRRLGIVQLLLPIALVAVAVLHYGHALPTTADGVLLVLLGPAVGVTLGIGAAALTRVWRKDGHPFARATPAAAALWVLGMGFRLAFQLWANSAAGQMHLTTFSVEHRIEESAWVDALLLMAVGEVLGRTVVLFVRGRIVGARRRPQMIGV